MIKANLFQEKFFTKLTFCKLVLMVFVLGVTAVTSSVSCWAYTDLSVPRNKYAPMPLLLGKFIGDEDSAVVASNIENAINNDLKNSGAFLTTVQELKYVKVNGSLLQTNTLLSDISNYVVFVAGKIVHQANGNYDLQYIVWDVYNKKPLIHNGFKLPQSLDSQQLAYIAHSISNQIYKAFTGEEGYFNSKIAFVSHRGIYTMDYDGNDVKLLYQGKDDLFTPIFSHGQRYIAYVCLNKGFSTIYLYDLTKHINYKLGNFRGLLLAPRFSPDDRTLIFSLSNRGCTNIFCMDFMSLKVRQITFSNAINIPGGYSPDGQQIVFNSDQKGKPQIFVADKLGLKQKTLTDLKGSYYTPTWSPRGDLIAYTKILPGQNFAIGVMDPKGNNSRLLANDYGCEGPSWSCNGRNLVYQFIYDSANRKYAFYLLNVFNNYKFLLQPTDDSRDPCFSENINNSRLDAMQYNLSLEITTSPTPILNKINH